MTVSFYSALGQNLNPLSDLENVDVEDNFDFADDADAEEVDEDVKVGGRNGVKMDDVLDDILAVDESSLIANCLVACPKPTRLHSLFES